MNRPISGAFAALEGSAMSGFSTQVSERRPRPALVRLGREDPILDALQEIRGNFETVQETLKAHREVTG